MASVPRFWRLFSIYVDEVRAGGVRPRVPEPMVMEEDAAVGGFEEAAEDASGLVAIYEVSARAVHGFLPEGGQVVDIGCGPGEFARYLAERRPDCRVLGLDLSKPMIGRARERIERAGLAGRVSFAQADATELPEGVLPERIDVLSCLNLLHQFPDEETLDRCLAAIARVRERYGCAVWLLDLVRFGNPRTMQRTLEAFEPELSHAAVKNTLESEAAAFTVDELRDRLVAAGLGDLAWRTSRGLKFWQSHWCGPAGRAPGSYRSAPLPPEVRLQLVPYSSLIPER